MTAARFPARRVTRGGGPLGKKGEELEDYLWVVLLGVEATGDGLSTVASGLSWRRRWPMALWWWKEGVAGLRSFKEGLERWWCCGFGQWDGAEAAPRGALLAGGNGGQRAEFCARRGVLLLFTDVLGFVAKLATSGGG